MLYGQRIIIWTDHKNLTYMATQFSSDRVLRQRLSIEEFGPIIKHIDGERNIAADTMSRIEEAEKKVDINKFMEETSAKQESHVIYETFAMEEEYIVPINYLEIHRAQRDDIELRKFRTADTTKKNYSITKYGTLEIWMKQSQNDKKWRIFVPKTLRQPLINWYHDNLLHAGQRRMEESVLRYFTWPGCTADIERFVKSCETCQKNKSTNTGRAGKIPLKDPPEYEPWDMLTVDLCGPWKTIIEDESSKKKSKMQIWALTMVDEATGWIEIIPIQNKESKNIAYIVDAEWFCIYPRPKYCLYDNGTEFTGDEFQELLTSYGIEKKPTTVKNPQANAMHERTHLVLTEMLRTQEIKVEKGSTSEMEIRRVLQCCAFAIRATTNLTTKYSPSHLIFSRDMIMHQKEVADWELLRERKVVQQTKDNERENKGRSNHTYQVGEKVLVLTRANERGGKLLKYQHKGPYEIMKIYSNGTVKIRCGNFDEIIHIRRLRPFYEREQNNP